MRSVPVFLVLAMSGVPCIRAGAIAPPFAFTQARVIVNAVDGAGPWQCTIPGETAPGASQRFWISFGEVRPGKGESPEFESAALRCGEGLPPAGLVKPYLLARGEITPRGQPGDALRLKAAYEVAAFPGAAARSRQREFDAAAGWISVLLDDRDPGMAALRAHEVLLRIEGHWWMPGSPAGFGAVEVSSDEPGARVWLDGDPAGWIDDQGTARLAAVLAGGRRLLVRDFSGRESGRVVRVSAGSVARVALPVLNLGGFDMKDALVALGPGPSGHAEYWRGKDGALMVEIPAGEFIMGSDEGQGEPAERPRRRIDLPAFLIDKTEVTWRQYRRFAASTGTALPPVPLWGAPDDYAVSNVLWKEAAAYCDWADGRLPAEAEWEKAARGTGGSIYPWGDGYEPGRCNAWEGGAHRPLSAGTHRACSSPYGILDMSGGVWEWCQDSWKAGGRHDEGASKAPADPAALPMKVLKGGCWNSQPSWVRPAYRHRLDTATRHVSNGFRCARDIP